MKKNILKPVAHLIGAVALALGGFSAAHAGAPMAKTASPGFFRMMLGQFEVTALSDGTVDLPVDQLLNNPAAKTHKAVKGAFLNVPTETSDNAFLVNTGSRLVLIDSGAGGLFGPTLGKLVENLKASGYQPDQVDDIVITHMHADHVGGLAADGKPVFPNATVHADKADADFWLSQANLDKASAEMKGFFQGAMASLNPYVTTGKFKPFSADTEIAPGVRTQSAHGHTPGHTVYVVESGGQKLVLVGDLIHVGAVQFPHPEVTIKFDVDAKAAAAARAKVFSRAAKEGAVVGAAHIQFPGLGRLRPAGKGYEWVPVNHTRMP